jgi:hypothetical protein
MRNSLTVARVLTMTIALMGTLLLTLQNQSFR